MKAAFNRLELLRIFTAAASSASFREAAARLGVSPQVVTRAVQELEQELDETLFHRNTRRVQITTYGQGFAVHAQAALHVVDQLFGSPGGETEELRGTVRITAPAFLGRTYVMPVLSELMATHHDRLIVTAWRSRSFLLGIHRRRLYLWRRILRKCFSNADARHEVWGRSSRTRCHHEYLRV